MGIKTFKGIIYPNGDINKHLIKVVKNARPYVTLKELITELINFIGEKEFYFVEQYERWWSNGRSIERLIQHCNLVNINLRK